MTERDTKNVTIPELCLVVLIGVSGSGKSTFAARHFLPTEVISSDFCRALVSDDENDQGATEDAFAVLHFIAGKRLAAGKLVVVDATNVQREARAGLVKLAKEHHVLPVAIVLDVKESVCQERNAQRADRDFGPHVVRRQRQQLQRSVRGLNKEGFRRVFFLRDGQIDTAAVERERQWTDKRDERGPFDIIGDVHGCGAELRALLAELGYELRIDDAGRTVGARHPGGRKVVFLGDLVDRGPEIPGVLRLAMGMVADGDALCIPGNHESKLLRAMSGRNVQVTHGLAESLAQLGEEPEEFRSDVKRFIDKLVSHYVLDDGNLVVAHAGMRADMQGRASAAVRSFALYGDTTGETDEYGLPVRYPWADDYRGRAAIVYGHTPVPEPVWHNGTVCVDTGCVFGGSLTALRWPEREFVAVPAAATYYEPSRPFLPDGASAPDAERDRPGTLLDVGDVLGKRIVSTRLMQNLTVREENAIAALEVMSRFAVDPRWLVYLPPTMAPTATASVEGLLEHPAEAFAQYRHDGVGLVVCEEKHMGSRAVVVVCRTPGVARATFGIPDDETLGVIYTRTGRPFFADSAWERALLERVAAAAESSGLWDELASDWMVLDCELLPWSAKAEDLLRTQYAAVGAAAQLSTHAAGAVVRDALARGIELGDVANAIEQQATNAQRFVRAYREYCWPVTTVDDVRLAPFQILAARGELYAARDHRWHLEQLGRLCAADDGAFRPTRSIVVDVTDPASEQRGIDWWTELTGGGGEGMVVKPVEPISRGPKGVVQPGIKCRGREYLRIIYGPDYDEPQNLERLRKRGLGLKRSLAAREFALGVESLERFVREEPLYRVHEAVFAVLALESEPVDPRL